MNEVKNLQNLPSIHFNDTVFSGLWVKSILDVTFTNDAKMSDNLEGSATKHMVLIIGQRLRRCNDNGITGMCAERIKILHIAANDSIL